MTADCSRRNPFGIFGFAAMAEKVTKVTVRRMATRDLLGMARLLSLEISVTREDHNSGNAAILGCRTAKGQQRLGARASRPQSSAVSAGDRAAIGRDARSLRTRRPRSFWW